MKRLINFALILFISIGCASNNNSEINNEDQQTLAEAVSGNMVFLYGHPEKTAGTELITDYDWYFMEPGEQRDKIREEAIAFHRESYRIAAPVIEKIAKSDELNAVQFIAETNLYFEENISERSLYIAKQMIASQIQRHVTPRYFLQDGLNKERISPLSDNEKQLLNYATALMVENGNPNADIIAFNISLLQNSISDDLLKKYSCLGIENAHRWIKEQDNFFMKEYMLKKACTSCDDELALLLKELNQNEKRALINKAIVSLQNSSPGEPGEE